MVKKYKYVGEDEHHLKVQHPDGSTFSIAKNAVGKMLHKHIKDLEPVKMADGGEAMDKYLNEGSSSMPNPDHSMANYSASESVPNYAQTQSTSQAPLDIVPAESQPDAQQPLAIEPAPEEMAARQPSSAPIMPQMPAQQAPMQQGMPSLAPSQEKAFAAQEQGVKNIAAAQQHAYAGVAKEQQHIAMQAAAIDAELKKHTDPLEAENAALFSDIKDKKIDPNRLYHNMGAGNKAMAGIGIVLAGIGAGMLHQSGNVGMEALQKNIDRDIDAQKSDLGKSQTLFSDNLRRLGDARSAAAATKMQMLTVSQAQISSMMANAQSQEALQRGNVALAQIQLQKDQLKNQVGIRQMAQGGGNIDPAVFVPHLVPKERQADVSKEIQAAQNIRRGANEGLNAFEQANSEQKIGSKNVIPGVNSPYIGQLKASVLPQFQNIDGTVRQAAMDAFLPTITPAVGDSKHTIDVKRQTLKNWYMAHSSAPTAKEYGIDLDRFGSTTSAQPAQMVERLDPKTGKIAVFNADTKQFVRYK